MDVGVIKGIGQPSLVQQRFDFGLRFVFDRGSLQIAGEQAHQDGGIAVKVGGQREGAFDPAVLQHVHRPLGKGSQRQTSDDVRRVSAVRVGEKGFQINGSDLRIGYMCISFKKIPNISTKCLNRSVTLSQVTLIMFTVYPLFPSKNFKL